MGERAAPLAVLAGSAAFITAVEEALARRLGAPPRAADTPHLAFAFSQDDAGLLVFEYAGLEWLAVCEDLKRVAGDALALVAAVPAPHAAAMAALIEAGVDEVVAWEGRAEAVLAAVERVLADERAVRPVEPRPEGDEPNFSIVEAPPPDVAAQWGDAELVAFERSSTWPGTVLGSADAEGVLAGALAGFMPAIEALRAQVERVLPALTAPERDALRGAAVPTDGSALCRAAGLRFQLSVARASAPEGEEPVDAAAVRAILAEVDAVLAELKRLDDGAAPAARGALGDVRRALVGEAVDFAEAVHRVSPSEAPAAAPPVARGVPVARILPARPAAPPEVRLPPGEEDHGDGAVPVSAVARRGRPA